MEFLAVDRAWIVRSNGQNLERRDAGLEMESIFWDLDGVFLRHSLSLLTKRANGASPKRTLGLYYSTIVVVWMVVNVYKQKPLFLLCIHTMVLTQERDREREREGIVFVRTTLQPNEPSFDISEEFPHSLSIPEVSVVATAGTGRTVVLLKSSQEFLFKPFYSTRPHTA